MRWVRNVDGALELRDARDQLVGGVWRVVLIFGPAPHTRFVAMHYGPYCFVGFYTSEADAKRAVKLHPGVAPGAGS